MRTLLQGYTRSSSFTRIRLQWHFAWNATFRPSRFSVRWCTTTQRSILRTSNIDPEACWKLLGREMFRACNRVNHHFRCPAGEARFTWLIKHTMVASTNDFPRLVIRKSAAEPTETGLARFATHYYAEENALPEYYILTIDEHMACRLSETEQRVSVREMCQRFFDVLCTSSLTRKLVQSASCQ